MPKLTPAERAILIKQYEILEILRECKFKEEIEALSSGYQTEYEDLIDGLGEHMASKDCKMVTDILWLYYLMKLAKNKAALENPGGDREPDGRLRMQKLEPAFPGFDGNNEGRKLSYAKYLIEGRGQFEENKENYLNSHGSQPDYDGMLEVWKSWNSPVDLTEAQVDELLAIH